MDIYLADKQGFCVGVSRAIDIVVRVLKKYGAPVYVRHHIVHNTSVIKSFEEQGVIFVEDISVLPEGSIVIFSAHGVAPSVYKEAESKKLRYIDATCPLVRKVHKKADYYSRKKIKTILIGHKGHQEIIGTSGYIEDSLLNIVENEHDIDRLNIDANEIIGCLTQTTLSVAETSGLITKIKNKFASMLESDGICFATQHRQDAVIELAGFCDIIIICGSPSSSNSNRLLETAKSMNKKSYIIDVADELNMKWLQGVKTAGISSGASVPFYIVEDVINKIKSVYSVTIHRKKEEEKKKVFDMPDI
ncbi:MAG: 4-hydroxy-3-methylbut-2-enyl diphosphate reductase [bacterium]|nr:4-hydroxy-3-methylbut-2-enyl diphosphate reductase [bacterium]